MDSYHTVLSIGDECKSVFRRLEAGVATIGNLMFDIEMMLLAELVPVFLLALRQYQDDIQMLIVFMKALDGAHQDRLASYWQELLGNLTSHAETFAPGYYNYVIHIFLFTCSS